MIRWLLVFLFTAFSMTTTAATIRVVDQKGQPQVGAKVLIGTAANQPFPGNQLVTDANGQFQTPSGWSQPLPVTIEGSDLVRTTHMNTTPGVQQLVVSHSDGDQKIQVQGELKDYGPIRTDGKVDVGVFIPAIPVNELIYFDVGWMISPENDSLRILGKDVAIPSNIALPRQQESYIFPITLDKPTFRMFVRKPGNYRFLALHGQFPLKRVVDDIRAGMPIFDVVNHVQLIQSGLVDLNISGPMSNLSVPVNKMSFTSSVNVQAPRLEADDLVLSLAFSTVDASGSLLPSDIKRLQSGQSLTLKTPANAEAPRILSAWMKQTSTPLAPQISPVGALDFEHISEDLLFSLFQNSEIQAAKVDYKQVSFAVHNPGSTAPQFISLVQRPAVNGDRIQLTPPTAPTGVTPLSTLVMYSAIETIANGKVKTEKRTRLWEIWLPQWASEVTLPSLTALPRDDRKFRWEVLYIGKDGTHDFSHVSRNAQDL